MGSAKKLQRRAAPRYRFEEEAKSYIRFTSNQHRDIHTTRIFDISQTGLAFTCSKRLAPRIGTTLRMEFSPSGGVQMAVLGRVVRIEEPREHSEWAKFPGTVKLGVQFKNMPKQYVHLISEIISENVTEEEFRVMNSPVMLVKKSERHQRPNWFLDNFWTILAGLLIVGFAVYCFTLILDKAAERPQTPDAPWASNFFDKVIKKPDQ